MTSREASGDELVLDSRISPIPWSRVAGLANDTLFASDHEYQSDSSRDVTEGCIKQIEYHQNVVECGESDVNGFAPSPSGDELFDSPSICEGPSSSLSQYEENFFILSDAGKPIFSLYGKEEEYVTLFGIMQALVSFVEDPCISTPHDALQSISFSDWKCTFIKKGPIILVACSRNCDVTIFELKDRTMQMYYLILSILTKTQVTKIFETRKNYDLRKLLTGTEKSFHALYDLTRSEPAVALHAVRVFPMQAHMRDSISSAMSNACAKAKAPIVFGLLCCSGAQLITVVRMKKYTLHADDVHLVLNMIQCNPSFKTANVSWVPICLPRFDDSGFLHAFISYIADEVCLVLLTVDRNSFDELLQTQQRFIDPLLKSKIYTPLCDMCTEPSVPFKLSELGIYDLWHFVYKNQKSHYLCSPCFEPPYSSEKERARLVARYMKLIHFTQHAYDKGPLRILYQSGERECLLAWVREEFELYATFSPLVTKLSAITRIDKILKWLKKDEDRIFLMNPLTF